MSWTAHTLTACLLSGRLRLTPPDLPIGPPILLTVATLRGTTPDPLPEGHALRVTALPAGAGSPILFQTAAFTPAPEPGIYQGTLPTHTAAALAHLASPPVGPKRIDLDLTLSNASGHTLFAARTPAHLLPLISTEEPPLPEITGGRLLIVAAPASPTDFSMFPGGTAPATGSFEATDAAYCYRYVAGWPEWQRFPMAAWGNLPA